MCYVVFRTWERACEVPGNTTKATVPNLIEGEEYEFRIIAVNKGGHSEPSEASIPVIAKPRFQAPIFNKSLLEDITVKVGQRFGWTIPIEASPKPTAKWAINGKEIEPSDRIDMAVYNNKVSFDVTSALRTDTGRYTLTLTNDLGSFSASAQVNVLDKPGPPQPPLDVSCVTKESARLSWKTPLDDGGSPILHYIVEKMDVSRGTWSDAGMATITSHDITRLIHRKEYYFRIKAVNAIGESEPLETTKSIIAKNEFGTFQLDQYFTINLIYFIHFKMNLVLPENQLLLIGTKIMLTWNGLHQKAMVVHLSPDT